MKYLKYIILAILFWSLDRNGLISTYLMYLTAKMDSWPNFKLFRPKLSRNRTKNSKNRLNPEICLYSIVLVV